MKTISLTETNRSRKKEFQRSPDTAGHGESLLAVRMTHEELGKESRSFKSYYGFDGIASQEARARWLTPDGKPLKMPFAV